MISFKRRTIVSDKDPQRNVSGVCIFCEIAKGTVPASMVFVDEHVLAFLSLEQPNPYKVLIITREHAATLYDLTDEQAAHIFQSAVHIARIIRTVSGCEGLNVVQSNGTVGQQDVFHFHLHLVPRVARDTQQGRIVLNWDNTPRERRELDRLAADLRMQIQRHED
jgi:histidine triad (HIT) family protein